MHGLRTFYAMYNVFLGTPKIQSGILGFNFPLVLSPERKLLKVQAPKKTYMFMSSLSKLYHDTRVQYHIHKLDENLLRRYWIYLDLINWIDFTKTFKQIVGWLSSARKIEEGDEIFSNVFQKWRFVSLSLLGPLRIRAFYNEEILFKKNISYMWRSWIRNVQMNT